MRSSAVTTPSTGRPWVAAVGAWPSGHAVAFVLVLIAVLLASPATASADDQIEQQMREIAEDLRCPVCQNISVADSQSELAGEMRDLIRKRLAAGQTREEIFSYFVERYGEEVLLDPPKVGPGQLVWWGAALIPLAGVLIAGLFIRGRVRGSVAPRASEQALSESERRRYEAMLERELERAGGITRW